MLECISVWRQQKMPVSLATSFLTGKPPLKTDMHSNIGPGGPFETIWYILVKMAVIW